MFILKKGHQLGVYVPLRALFLVQEEQLSVHGKRICTISTGKLPLGGLCRNSVVRINDCPDMTSAVYCARKALVNQTKWQAGQII